MRKPSYWWLKGVMGGSLWVTPPPPTATPTPDFWAENSKAIIAALITLVIGGLLGALLKPAFERLGNALADGLSKLGSGWGFRRRYRAHLIEEHRCLKMSGLRDLAAPGALELEQVYVSLQAQAAAARGQTVPPIGIGAALAQHRRLVIVGGPGAGKTTLLAYLALTCARGQVKARLGLRERRLPVLVPLRQLRPVLTDSTTLAAGVTAYYARRGLPVPPRFFERQLQAGRCLVLLDGLDEVADEAERRRLAEWVDQQVALYPQNRYVVTSRPAGYASAPLSNGFELLTIRDFTDAEIRRFAENWCLAVELARPAAERGRAARQAAEAAARRQATAAARDLTAAIAAHPAIRKLAVNPLLLSIIALVHRYRATLPKRRVDLYAECVEVLLSHWDAAKGLLGRLDAGQKRAALQALALSWQETSRRDCSRRELERELAALLPAVSGQPVAPGAAAAFVDEVRDRSGLLVEVEAERYAFSHLTFQEYLAARELVDNEARRPLLLTHLTEPWWQEVALLYAGLTDATPLVAALLAPPADEGRLLLAGRCVAEAMRLEPARRAQVVRALETAFATCTGERFAQVGQVLAEIAGEDSLAFFLKIAHTDPARRAAALEALATLARPPAAPGERALAQLLAHFERGDWQAEAGGALAALWGPRLAAELQARGVAPELRKRALMLTLVRIPAGEFLYGDKKEKVTLPEYWMDRAPVTNAEFALFVAMTGYRTTAEQEGTGYVYSKGKGGSDVKGADWQHPTGPGSGIDDKLDHPVVQVSWADAAAYAAWGGKRLPSEQEWEKAARGTDGRTYPWGNEAPTPARANYGHKVGGTTPVGRYSPAGDSPYGCVDMAGNVWEWTATDYDQSPKVVRGGSWNIVASGLPCACRLRGRPAIRDDILGFRCVLARPGD